MTKDTDPAVDRDAALRRIRTWLWIFIVCLVLSGLTAFPLESETRWLASAIDGSGVGGHWPALAGRAAQVRDGIAETNARYPFLAYGTDWLAFAHLVIAAAFWGPLRDPVRNVWVIRWALLACAGVLPLALVCGPLRGIPLYWRFIDMSFGVVGAVPLLIVLRAVRRLEWSRAVTVPNGFTAPAPVR
ncbi:hypothetical protein [Kitasatospora sp. DSM 101779]|uniref:hypothetical protein n=1 Tax=Kitasatospora sp. DSM 101779 TaxID=2853165 RepID=UPI0021D9F66C|nr:hypothetical protein [Kitasatospora sp. DSM 101779]MCU7825787.1 hypothetical protein [Kitasatospora sp. DSM 101779]